MAAEENEAIGEGIDQAVGNLDAAAAGSDVIPNVVEIGIGLRSAQMSHKRDVFCLQVSRARPRCFTLSASPGERFLVGGELYFHRFQRKDCDRRPLSSRRKA
jgi:hypothetical protein